MKPMLSMDHVGGTSMDPGWASELRCCENPKLPEIGGP